MTENINVREELLSTLREYNLDENDIQFVSCVVDRKKKYFRWQDFIDMARNLSYDDDTIVNLTTKVVASTWWLERYVFNDRFEWTCIRHEVMGGTFTSPQPSFIVTTWTS